MLLLLACSGPPADTGGTPNPDGTNTAPTAEVLLAPDVLTAATDIVAAAKPTPFNRKLTTRQILMANAKNCSGARTPCTNVHTVASRRARSAGVYSVCFCRVDAG